MDKKPNITKYEIDACIFVVVCFVLIGIVATAIAWNILW